MKRFLTLLATGAFALGLSSSSVFAQAPARSLGAGGLILTDPLSHQVTITPPVNPSPEYTAWSNAGFPNLNWSVPVPPFNNAQSGFLFSGPLVPTGPGPVTAPYTLTYWVGPGFSGINNNGGTAGAWDYATTADLGILTGGGGITNQIPVWTSPTTLGNSAISDDGTTITAAEDLAMGGNSITGATDVTAAGTVSGGTGTFTNLSGTTMTGDLAMGGNSVTGANNLTASGTVSGGTGTFTNLSGTTMTGDLAMGGNSVTGADNLTASGTVSGGTGTFTNLSGTTMTGDLAMGGNSVTGANDLTATGTVSGGTGTFTNLSGTTMTGDLAMGGNSVTGANDLTATGTVSGGTGTFTNLSGTTMTGDLAMGGNSVTGATDLTATGTVSGGTGTFTTLSGTTMGGDLALGGNNITGGGNITGATITGTAFSGGTGSFAGITNTGSLDQTGTLLLDGVNSPLEANGDDGTSGYFLKSQGTGLTPVWSDLGSNIVTSATGTINQVFVDGDLLAHTGDITISLPQDIAATSTPIFGGMTLNGDLVMSGNSVTGAADVTASGTVSGGTGTFTNLSGTTMTGDLAMGGNSLTGATDVTASGTVSGGTGTFTNLSGTTMTGTLDMGTNSITNVVDPLNPQDAATKNYVDNSITNAVSGTVNTMAKFTSANAVGNSLLTDDGSNLVYNGNLDISSAGSVTGATDVTASGTVSGVTGTFTNLSGTTMTGDLAMGGNSVSGATDVTASGTVSGGTGTFTNLSGTTMTGDLAMGGNSLTGATDVTASGTVSGGTGTFTNLSGTTMTGDLAMGGNSISGATDVTASGTVSGGTGTFTNLSGTTMTGTLDMGGNDITNGGNITGTTIAGTAFSGGSGSFTTLTSLGDANINTSGSAGTNIGTGTYGGTITIGNDATPSTTVLAGNVSFTTPPSIPLTTDHIFVGNAGIAQDVAMSQDASIIAGGAVTVSSYNGGTLFGDMASQSSSSVNITGGTINGVAITLSTLDMGGATITSVGDPVNPQDAATKNYVDNSVTSAVSGTVNTMAKFTGANAVGNSLLTDDGSNLVYNGNLDISSAGAVTGATDVTASGTVSGSTGTFLNLSGTTMLGNLNMGGNDITAGGTGTFLSLSGTTMLGNLNMGGNDITAGGTGTFLSLSGTTMLGNLNMGGNDITAGGTGTFLSLSGTTMLGNLNMGGNDITAGGTGTFLSLSGTTMLGNLNMGGNDITNGGTGTFLNLSGTTMTGTLDMGTNLITNVVDPVNPQDAATKNYVDNSVTGAVSGTVNTMAKFTGANAVGNSLLTDDGSNLVYNGNLDISSAGAITGATDVTASGTVSGGTGTFTNLSGTTMTGDLAMGGNSVSGATDVTASGTVSGGTGTFTNLSGTTMTGDLAMGGNSISGATDVTATGTVTGGTGTFTNLSGTTMTGTLDMGGNDITNGGNITGTAFSGGSGSFTTLTSLGDANINTSGSAGTNIGTGTYGGTITIGNDATPSTTVLAGNVSFTTPPSIPLTTDHIFVGNAGVAQDVAMSQDASIVAGGAVTVTGASGDFAVTGNETVGGTLGVTGLSSLNGLTNTGALTETGNETVSGTLGVTGATTLAATDIEGVTTINTTSGSTTSIGENTAALNLAGHPINLDPGTGGGPTGSVNVTQGNLSVQLGNVGIATGTLGVGGATRIDHSGNMPNVGTLNATGDATFGGAGTGLAVTNNATIGGTVTITGATTLSALSDGVVHATGGTGLLATGQIATGDMAPGGTNTFLTTNNGGTVGWNALSVDNVTLSGNGSNNALAINLNTVNTWTNEVIIHPSAANNTTALLVEQSAAAVPSTNIFAVTATNGTSKYLSVGKTGQVNVGDGTTPGTLNMHFFTGGGGIQTQITSTETALRSIAFPDASGTLSLTTSAGTTLFTGPTVARTFTLPDANATLVTTTTLDNNTLAASVTSLDVSGASTTAGISNTGTLTQTGAFNLSGASSPLEANGSDGTPGYFLASGGTGNTPTWSNSLPATTTISFSQITSGTNIQPATMTIGAGSSLTTFGSGTISGSIQGAAISLSTLDMGGATITTVGDPVNSDDAATKNYVDNNANVTGTANFIPVFTGTHAIGNSPVQTGGGNDLSGTNWMIDNGGFVYTDQVQSYTGGGLNLDPGTGAVVVTEGAGIELFSGAGNIKIDVGTGHLNIGTETRIDNNGNMYHVGDMTAAGTLLLNSTGSGSTTIGNTAGATTTTVAGTVLYSYDASGNASYTVPAGVTVVDLTGNGGVTVTLPVVSTNGQLLYITNDGDTITSGDVAVPNGSTWTLVYAGGAWHHAN